MHFFIRHQLASGGPVLQVRVRSQPSLTESATQTQMSASLQGPSFSLSLSLSVSDRGHWGQAARKYRASQQGIGHAVKCNNRHHHFLSISNVSACRTTIAFIYHRNTLTWGKEAALQLLRPRHIAESRATSGISLHFSSSASLTLNQGHFSSASFSPSAGRSASALEVCGKCQMASWALLKYWPQARTDEASRDYSQEQFSTHVRQVRISLQGTSASA